jgi:hypothetical protein
MAEEKGKICNGNMTTFKMRVVEAIIISIVVAGITTFASAYITGVKLEVSLNHFKESLCEIKSNIKEISSDVKDHIANYRVHNTRERR